MRIAPVLLSAAFLTLLCCSSHAQDKKPKPRNVLFLIADDLGAQALGCYGNTQCRTPNIDRLAAESARFTRAYSQYPICGPSRAALMAGTYPEVLGILGNGSSEQFESVMGDTPSLPEHFRNNGYHTARVGKIYHMRVPGDITACVDGADHPQSWVEKHNCCGPEWMTEGKSTHLSNEKLNRDPDKHYGLGFGSAFYVVESAPDAATQPDVQAADKAIEIIEAQQEAPFFLAVGFVRPHVPLVAPPDFFEPYEAAAMKLPEKREGDQADIPRPGKTRTSASMGIEAAATQQEVLRAYYASVEFMDAQVGRVLETLDRLGLKENTLVVFTSDHGYHLGEHDLWQKVSLHEESVRIPLLVDVPGMAPAEPNLLVEQIDLYPTLAELCGLDRIPRVQGQSVVQALGGDDSEIRDVAYSITRDGALLRSDRFAYMEYRDGARELYDMQKDPQQFDNLATDPVMKETVEELAARLKARRAQITASSKKF